MNVAVVISNYYPYIGGAEIFAQRLAEYLVGERIRPMTQELKREN